MTKILLASASPRRRNLIKRIKDIDVITCSSNFDERFMSDGGDTAAFNALGKACSVKSKDRVILALDTVVVYDGKVLGKPETESDARAMFAQLCANRHFVVTGVCLKEGDRIALKTEVSVVAFGNYDKACVDAYIDSKACYDKAGGYGIGDELLKPLNIKVLSGSVENVMGFPVDTVERMIKEFDNGSN